MRDTESDIISQSNFQSLDYVLKRVNTRARNALERLGVDSLRQFLSLQEEDILSLRHCGEDTWNEIKNQQKRILELKRKAMNTEFLEDSFIQKYEDIVGMLSTRAKRVIEILQANNLEDFVKIKMCDAVTIKNIGITTWQEIEKLRDEVLKHNPHLRELIPIEHSSLSLFQVCYDSYEDMIHSWVQNTTSNERRSSIFAHWVGTKTPYAPTLEECGKVFGLSRERIRQIVARVRRQLSHHKSKDAIKDFSNEVVLILESAGGAIEVAELSRRLAMHFNWKNVPSVGSLSRILEITSKINFLDGDIISLPSNPCMSCEGLRKEFEKLMIAQEIAISDVKKSLVSYCRSSRCSNSLIIPGSFSDAFIKILMENTSLYGKLVVHNGKIYTTERYCLLYGTISSAAPLILKSTGEPMHFTEVHKHFHQWRNDKVSPNMIHNALANSRDAIRFGRGTFIHSDLVDCPNTLMKKINRWTLKELINDIPCITIYRIHRRFRSECKDAGLPTPDVLYECMRLFSHKRLAFPRFPYIYENGGQVVHIPLALHIEQWLEEMGEPVSENEIKRYVCDGIGAKKFQLDQALYRMPNVLKKGNNDYIHVSATPLTQDRINELLSCVKGLIRQNEHVSVNKVFSEREVSCRVLGITDSKMLYSVFHNFASEDIEFPGYPQLKNPEAAVDAKGIIAEVTDYIRRKGSLCTYEELEQYFVDELGYREQSIYTVTRSENVFRYLPSCLVHADTIKWSETKGATLLEIMENAFKEAIKRGESFERVDWVLEEKEESLPVLSNDLIWTPTLLADIADRMSRLSILGNARNAYIIIPNKLGIGSFGELVGYILRTRFGGAANLEEFSGVLRENGIVKKRITSSMLRDNDPLEIAGHEIFHKEILRYAKRH